MKKRLLTAFLAIMMLVSSVPSAMAAKKPAASEGGDATASAENIYALWGDFENPASIDMISLNTKEGDNKLHERGGANGTKYSLRIDSSMTRQAKEPHIPMPVVPGETYTLRFWYKVNSFTGDQLNLIFIPKTGGWQYFTGITGLADKKDWTLYEYVWTVPDKFNGKDFVPTIGDTVDASDYFEFRGGRMDMARPIDFQIDELELIPHGNKPEADYSSVNNGYAPVEFTSPNTSAEPVETTDVNFTDVNNHWAKDVINDLAKYGYVNGMGNGTYAPDSTLTRAQFIKMVADLYDMEAPVYDGRFKDVAGNEWYMASLVTADDLGLIDVAMKIGGVINPNAPITREEAATIAARVAKERGAKADAANATSFADAASISKWAAAGVKDAASFGLIKGYEDGSYKPAATLTRAEAAQILFRIVEIKSKMHIYVDAQNGNDIYGDGSTANPYATVEKARDVAAQYAPTMENDIKIMLRGIFKVLDPIELKAEHSGANGYSIIYTSWGTERPVITTASEFTNFELHDAEKNIWKTYVGSTYSRQVYFNDIKGMRARTAGRLTNCTLVNKEYLLCDNEYLLNIPYPEEVEMSFQVLWGNPRFLVQDIVKTDDGRVKIIPHNRFRKDNYYHAYYNGEDSPSNGPRWLENAYEFLNEKGEWYINKHDGYLYYIPRTGEDMSTMVAKVPTGEQLLTGHGYSPYDKVSNITFKNICFEGTSFFKVERDGGWNTAQDGVTQEINEKIYNHTSYNQPWAQKIEDAAIDFSYCDNIKFLENTIRFMGGHAVVFREASTHIDIIGNEMYELACNGIMVDIVTAKGEGYPDQRPQDTWCEYIRVNNNFIYNVAQEKQDCAAISSAYPRHAQFNHNEIFSTTYSGYHIGWGWYKYGEMGTIMYDVEICNNFIHNVFLDRSYDGGAIYTIGASSFECEQTNIEKNNRIYENYIYNSFCSYIYPDEGSTSWHISNNVIDSTYAPYHEGTMDSEGKGSKAWSMHMHANSIKWMTLDNHFATCGYRDGMMNALESNVSPRIAIEPGKWEEWPDKAKEVMKNSGIEPEYQHLFDLDSPKVIISNDKVQSLSLETPTDAGLMVFGGRDGNTTFPITDFELDMHCDDPDALTLTPDGKWIAHKKGTFEGNICSTFRGHTYIIPFKLQCGDEVEKLTLNVNTINMLAGAKVDLQVLANFTFGSKDNVTAEATYDLKPDDPIVEMKLSTEGSTNVMNIISTGEIGETTLRGYVEYRGVRENIEIPIKIISYGNPETAKLEGLPVATMNLVNWKNSGVKVGADGYKVFGMPNNSVYVDNKLVAVDMVCEPGSDWPTIGFCDTDRMGNYNTNNLYMIGFKEDFIELQKFNKGKRTMFFGPENPGWTVLCGPGFPLEREDGTRVFEYGKRYSIVFGALKVENGTRIILNINGENIFDFVDDTYDAITPQGEIVIYNPDKDTNNGLWQNGGFTFYPFSNQIYEPVEE